MNIRRCFLLFSIILIFFSSCSVERSSVAILWTDRPELAFYTEYFNTSQDLHHVEVRYYENPARRLSETTEIPDMVVGSFLNSAGSRGFFRSLDHILDDEAAQAFYPRIYSLGRFDEQQILFPLSFNIPAIIFAQDPSQPPSNPFLIEMEEIKERSSAHNALVRDAFSRMGFTLSNNEDFLYLSAALYGANFREASPLAWEEWALQESIAYTQEWIQEVNRNVQMEDDFVFKFYNEPAERLLHTGLSLFLYMDSGSFFTLNDEIRANLDFRWIGSQESIPILESPVFFGIHRRGGANDAAEAFTRWLFNTETQRLLMEESRSKRIMEKSFGIAGGFSAMRTVTETVFPQFYPNLLGHLPPESFLSPGHVLPRNWTALKERVILPYLRESLRHGADTEILPLERRVNEWFRLNRE
ncbi:MAG: hypothetical protein FWH12_07800 [Treponema sp.]|nr:hypothetical protein [Treponema sp.]